MTESKRGFLGNPLGRAAFIGALHLLPLPGSAGWTGNMQPIVDLCLREAEQYMAAGADGLIIENTHDTPYLRQEADASTIAAMAVICGKLRAAFPAVPIGIQILAAADIAALDTAIACDLDFIRAEGFGYAHIADEGLIQGNAGRLIRRRAHLHANHIEIWTDIKKKHGSHALTADLSLREMAKGVQYFQADGIIVTGGTTGEPPSLQDLAAVSDLPMRLAVGSGTTLDNIALFAEHAEALIVGSACKVGGDWKGVVDQARVKALVSLL